MKPNKLWRSLLEEWPVKVFSFLLALVLYFLINYGMMDSKLVEIPLQVILPPGYEATSTIPSSVALRIRTDQRYIGMIDPTEVQAVADFSEVSGGGVAGVPILSQAEKSFVDIEVSFTTDPDILRVFFQKTSQSDSLDEAKDTGGETT